LAVNPKRQICRSGSQPSNDTNVALALEGLKAMNEVEIFGSFSDLLLIRNKTEGA
jgi:hypothetical protein